MLEAQYLKIEKTARYYLSGPLDNSYQTVCFVLHGYGQLAKFFVRPFTDTGLSNVLFVAPEGLHRFYLNGTKGRVGASWMSKEDRLKDIEDYCAYLDLLRDQLIPQVSFEDKESVGVLGFSQGAATACRWLSYSKHQFSYLLNYAGIYPPDLPEHIAIERMQNIPVIHLLGDKDEYITMDKMKESLEEFSKLGFPKDLKLFEGTHRIYPQVIETCFRDLGLVH